MTSTVKNGGSAAELKDLKFFSDPTEKFLTVGLGTIYTWTLVCPGPPPGRDRPAPFASSSAASPGPSPYRQRYRERRHLDTSP